MELDPKTAAAFGGCLKCYGKGYATTIQNAIWSGGLDPLFPYKPCSCDRGRQIEKMLTVAGEYYRKALKQEFSEFVDENYPKEKSKERGAVITHIAEFLAFAKRRMQ